MFILKRLRVDDHLLQAVFSLLYLLLFLISFRLNIASGCFHNKIQSVLKMCDYFFIVAGTNTLHELYDYFGDNNIIFTQLFDLFYQLMTQRLPLFFDILLVLFYTFWPIFFLFESSQLLFQSFLKTGSHRFNISMRFYLFSIIIFFDTFDWFQLLVIEQCVCIDSLVGLWSLQNRDWRFLDVFLCPDFDCFHIKYKSELTTIISYEWYQLVILIINRFIPMTKYESYAARHAK